MERIELTDEMLSVLRERVRDYLKPKRYLHTLAVEEEAARLGELFLPDRINALRAAALLHDITKRDDLEKQLQYCSEFGIIYDVLERSSPKLFHAKTAAELARRDFAEFVDDEIISGIRWHTTGREQMTVFESIVYLADYIEKTRTFPDCVELRRYFWGGIAEPGADVAEHFKKTMVLSFDMTIRNLIEENAPIDRDTVAARNRFILELRKD
ncbi:MAG: bis(5'-nucleosyl)-tetraphosphatase (symmetrical) YqeK [Clostridia bacterium]|nr:bis(5'-nucleosyl)-tetraphosphatase (symmetrical) YqeK [Clostridia bacterium]MBR6916432.1 bis(5'-nucleosyl)-tetraphosphatase (symmetrical) YqeK [Clostridia bacterium]